MAAGAVIWARFAFFAAVLFGSAPALASSTDGFGRLADVDLGTPEGLRLGHDAGRLAIGARIAQGVGLFHGRLVPAGVAGVFGSIGIDNSNQPLLRIEPTIGVGLGVSAGRVLRGPAVGLDVGVRFVEHDDSAGDRPWIGARLGADVILVPRAAIVVPGINLVLSW